MRSKVNFGHPKWPTAVILSKNVQQNLSWYRSEMARNSIESEFRTSKMGAGGHFVRQSVIKLCGYIQCRYYPPPPLLIIRYKTIT